MRSVYGEGGREASDLEDDSEQAGDEEALQGKDAVAVLHEVSCDERLLALFRCTQLVLGAQRRPDKQERTT